jgi:hypothetical protein
LAEDTFCKGKYADFFAFLIYELLKHACFGFNRKIERTRLIEAEEE